MPLAMVLDNGESAMVLSADAAGSSSSRLLSGNAGVVGGCLFWMRFQMNISNEYLSSFNLHDGDPTLT